jgi:hypothetical protein
MHRPGAMPCTNPAAMSPPCRPAKPAARDRGPADGAVRPELTRSVSAPLAAELCDLLPPQPASPSMGELRIECASLLGWTGGLVLEILDQVELAAAFTALSVRAGAQPGTPVPASA